MGSDLVTWSLKESRCPEEFESFSDSDGEDRPEAWLRVGSDRSL